MKLSKIERALIANQNRILSFLDDENSKSYIHKAEIAERGYEGLYEDLFSGIHEGISKEECSETHDILTMFRVINGFVSSLNKDEKKDLELKKISFDGFDANNDNHYFFMKYIVKEMGLYEELKGVVPNSHSISSITKYRRMLVSYNKVMKATNYQLDLDGLKSIINAS